MRMDQPSHGGNPPPLSKLKTLDASLQTIGFQMDELSSEKVSGYLLVTPNCCQPFKNLHGGVSALIAEALASMGAYIATGYRRVAGIQLSINHVKSAQVGEFVVAEATPINLGKSIQVWEVHLWKCDPLKQADKKLISSARVTLACNLPGPESGKSTALDLKRYAKL